MADAPDLSAIGSDVPAVITPSDLAKREELQFGLAQLQEHHAHEIRKRDRDLGSVGRFFGSRDNAITYVVAAFALVCIVLVAAFSFGNAELTKVAIEFFKAIGFASVGFITGKSLDKKD